MSDLGWLSVEQAGQRLGIEKKTVYRLIDRGGLTAYRIGRSIKVKVSDVDDFIEASVIRPGDLAHLYPAKDDE